MADELEITSTIDSPCSYSFQYGPWRPVINRLSVTKTANHPFAFRLFQYHSNLTMVLSSHGIQHLSLTPTSHRLPFISPLWTPGNLLPILLKNLPPFLALNMNHISSLDLFPPFPSSPSQVNSTPSITSSSSSKHAAAISRLPYPLTFFPPRRNSCP